MITVKELIEALQLEQDQEKYVTVLMRDYNEEYRIYEFDYALDRFEIVIAPKD